MAMDLGGAKGGVKSDINVTPLVDVMLVLLIIMMIVAPLLQKGVDVKLPSAANTQRQARDAGPDGRRRSTADKQVYLNAVQVRRSGPRADASTEILENKKEKIVLIKADEDADYGAVMEAMDELRPGRHRGHRPHHRAQGDAGGDGGRQVMAHAHKHFGADDGLQGEDAARQRGHERHAADRRAARAARHLHGRAAADAEGPRHQPAGRDASRRSSSRSTRSQIVLEYTADRRISVNKQDVTHRRARERGCATIFEQRKDKTMFIVGAPARCATATSSRSSTRPRAPASRRSASSPRACGKPQARSGQLDARIVRSVRRPLSEAAVLWSGDALSSGTAGS